MNTIPHLVAASSATADIALYICVVSFFIAGGVAIYLLWDKIQEHKRDMAKPVRISTAKTKKPVAKKAPAKKTAAKPATVKKSAVKAPAKKTVAKKPVAKKAPAKKTAAKKK